MFSPREFEGETGVTKSGHELFNAAGEWFVSLLDGLLETNFAGALRNWVPFLGVRGVAVEKRAKLLGPMRPLPRKRLIYQKFHHHQLIDRQPGDSRE